MVIMDECTLCVFILTQEPFIMFSLPFCVEEGSDREALVDTWNPGGVNPGQ